MKRLATVYLIRNCKNNKIYIGSTRRDKEVRWDEEIKSLVSGKHPNKQFIDDWNSTVASDWQFVELEGEIPIRLQFAVEQLYLDKYQSFQPDIGYNIKPKSRFIIRLAEDMVNKNEDLMNGIVQAIKDGVGYRDISNQFKVSTGTIHNIRKERLNNWSFKINKRYGLKDLTELDEVVKELESGEKSVEIAKKHGIRQCQVHDIKADHAPKKILRRLNADLKLKIFKLKEEGKTYREIQKETGVSIGSICNILRE